MTTQSWSSRIRHDSDITFREWGLEFSTKLAAAGLGRAADTGQINWTTITRPGLNLSPGYEIWYLNDSLHAVAPVYFRINYGTHAHSEAPRIQIAVGTGTNGAGTLTGTAQTASRPIEASGNQVVDTARQSFLCVTDGFFGLNHKIGSNPAEGAFYFARAIDTTTGLPSPVGAHVAWGYSTTYFGVAQSLRFASPAAAYAIATSPFAMAIAHNVGNVLSTLLPNGNVQAFVGWTITPAITPLAGICGVLANEINAYVTFQFAPVGSIVHTYLALGLLAGNAGPQITTAAGALVVAMLWE